MGFPELLQRWWDDAGLGPVPDEPRASCDACPQCALGGNQRPQHLATFNPRTKCCTYLPLLFNFQVGRILADPRPDMEPGRASLRARLAGRVGVTPLGLLWPAAYTRAYDDEHDQRFGRDASLRCPHYRDEAGGLCGIWRHRNSTCSTWFCRYERGSVGQRWWEEARRWLALQEEAVARRCLAVHSPGDDAVRAILDGDGPHGRLDGDAPITDAAWAAIWGRWRGQEEAYYRACAETAEAMTASERHALGGGRLARQAEELELAAEDLVNTRLPPFVAPDRLHEVAADGGLAWVYGFRSYDADPVPAAVLDLLRALGPTDTGDLASRLASAGLPEPVLPVLRRWIDAGLLRAATPDPA